LIDIVKNKNNIFVNTLKNDSFYEYRLQLKNWNRYTASMINEGSDYKSYSDCNIWIKTPNNTKDSEKMFILIREILMYSKFSDKSILLNN